MPAANRLPAGRIILYVLAVAAGLATWLTVRKPSAAPMPQTAAPAAAALVARDPLPEQAAAHAYRRPLEPAEWNPFAGWTPPPPPPPPPAKIVATPPPPPSTPPLNLTFVGRLTAPDGKESVFVLLDGNGLQLTAGQTLPNGYVVKTISARAVEFDYPPMNTTARLDLPEPPRYESR